MLVTLDQEYLKQGNSFSACGEGFMTPAWGIISCSDYNDDCSCNTDDCACVPVEVDCCC